MIGKGMNPIIPPPAMGKVTSQKNEYSEFKPVKLRLKIDPSGVVGKYDNQQ